MEDDDEFGDLYTDVLRPLSSASDSHQPPPAPSSLHPPINLQINPSQINGNDNDDDEILYGTRSGPKSLNPLTPSNNNSNNNNDNNNDDNNNYKIITDDNSSNANGGNSNRVSGSFDAAKESYSRSVVEEDVRFDIEETDADEDGAGGPVIPGLEGVMNAAGDASGAGREMDWEDRDEDRDAESDDSEDDLQIVLNDTSHGHHGAMGMDMMDGDDGDGELMIMLEDRDLGGGGEDGAAGGGSGIGVDGEKKEGGDGLAKGGGVVVPGGIRYGSHGFIQHPYHSQFKYVRPGAAPLPGAPVIGPGGAPGQVRPPLNMGPMAGRGRGEWRPPGMKGFHPGSGVPVWGSNMGGRAFGGGLDFTLPSHKTIFEVNIDSFDEKPWKSPNADITDFFNFGLNEETWKDYCKQLEQRRLETSMQSKIHVYESGRQQQEYDPDLPPELAAATGLNDVAANSNVGTLDVRENDTTKGTALERPQLPIGRPIQVECGNGTERLPSIDTRPPRIRDSDAVIEIVLQGSTDDDLSTGNGGLDGPDNSPARDGSRGSHVDEDDMKETKTEYLEQNPQVQKDDRRIPSREKGLEKEDDGKPREESHKQGISSHSAPNQSTPDKRFHDNEEEESIDSMDGEHSPRLLSSPITARDSRELSVEAKETTPSNENVLAEGSFATEKDEGIENVMTMDGTSEHDGVHYPLKKQKTSSSIKPHVERETDNDSKAARSSETSKGRSSSGKDHRNWQDGVDDEVVQGGRSMHSRSNKRRLDDNEQHYRRKDRDVRQEMERNHKSMKGKEDSYSHRDKDPSLSYHMKNEVYEYDRRKERENHDGAWQWREEDPNGKARTEETRKREFRDEMGSRQRTKVRGPERYEKEEHMQSRKQLDDGSYRFPYDKDGSSWHRGREDSSKNRYETVDDLRGMRKKDEAYLRKEHGDKDFFHSQGETTSHRRRERDDVLDHWKRDDQQRIRDGFDDYQNVRYKVKQSYEENTLQRGRDEVRDPVRIGRSNEYKGAADKEYEHKDAVRNSEQQKRRDRMTEDESSSRHRGRDDVHVRGSHTGHEDRRSRRDRSSIVVDHGVDNPDNYRVHERKHKERKNLESDTGDYNRMGPSRRNQEDQGARNDEMELKGISHQGKGKNEAAMQPNSPKRHREEEASSDDEQPDSRRGRSKLERWTSHTERGFSITSIKSSSDASLKFKENEKIPNEQPPHRIEAIEKHALVEEKDATDTKPTVDRHQDTVEKLKKRSERFKLPMPSERDLYAVKKAESDSMPSPKTEKPDDSEIKSERPARKRRWISK